MVRRIGGAASDSLCRRLRGLWGQIMAYWLIKSEPGTWSWDQQVAAGIEEWDGIRNHQAKNNLLAMRLGDRIFFYHSVTGTEIVGIVEVAAEAHPDSTDPTGKWFAVDVRVGLVAAEQGRSQSR